MKNQIIQAELIEQQAKQQFEYHVRIALQLSEPIHGWGDDNYGYLRQQFDRILSEYADSSRPLLAVSSSESEQVFRKKKLKTSFKKTVLERDQYRCIVCGSHKDLCVDHIHPESRGGSSELSNLQTLCRSCNSAKGTKAMTEWRGA